MRHTLGVRFEWDTRKNELLKESRNISFEIIALHLERGDLWRIGPQPKQDRYPHQQIFYVIIDDYIYSVPFEQRGDVIWLVTIFPSRKATGEYLKEKER